MAAYAAWVLAGTVDPSADDIARVDQSKITDTLVNSAADVVYQEYTKLGATDQVAKGPELKKIVRLQAELEILIT